MSVLTEFLIVIATILIGTRFGAVGIGVMSCAGLAILHLFFGLSPTAMPADVCFIILCVCTCSAVLEACGGLNFLIAIGAKIIRSNPTRLLLIAPIVMFFLTVFAGTAMVCFTLQPVIYEVAYANRIRPERAMVPATMAAQCAITACPISAATAALIGLFAHYGHPEISLATILTISLPAGLISVILISQLYRHWGAELKDDKIYQERLAAGLVTPPANAPLVTITTKSKFSLLIFAFGIIYIVSAGFFPTLRSFSSNHSPLSMTTTIELVMMATAATLICAFRPNMKQIAQSPILRSAVTTMISIVGCSWLADSFIAAHNAVILDVFGSLAQSMPWTFAFVLFVMSALMNSQGATTRAVMPMGFALGLSPLSLIAMFPAVNGIGLLPINGPALAACEIDRSGTTTMGRFLYDNPFQIFGTLNAILSVCIGFAIMFML